MPYTEDSLDVKTLPPASSTAPPPPRRPRPARSARRTAGRTAAVTLAGLSLTAGMSAAAHASPQSPVRPTWEVPEIRQVAIGWCFGTMDGYRRTVANQRWYVRGWLKSYGPTCFGSLWIKHGRGRYHQVSEEMYVTNGAEFTNNNPNAWWYDGPGYPLAKFCITTDTLQSRCSSPF
jgi:hypothetical protein